MRNYVTFTDKSTSVGMDGIVILAGEWWSDDNMKKLPNDPSKV